MKNHIDGYFDYRIIKGYKRSGDYLVVSYLDGREDWLDAGDEENILVLMEEQGRDYAKGFDDKKKYLFRVASGSSGLVVMFLGTLNWLEKMCASGINDETMVLGAIVGGSLIAGDIILFRKLFKDLASKIVLFDDQEKYNYYFKNKEVLENYIGINELDDCSMSDLRGMIKWKKGLKKVLRKKR